MTSTQFSFITEEWLDLQTWATQIRQLPHTAAAFTKLYGTFTDQEDTKTTVSALLASAHFAEQFGGATAVKQEIASNGAFLTSDKAPKMVYGHLIWWTMQVENAAMTVKFQLDSITSTTSAADIKAILSGAGGIHPVLSTAASQSGDLATVIANLRDHVTPQIEVFSGTSLVNEANQAIGQLDAQIASLKKKAAQDYKTWKHETLSPGASPPPIDASDDSGLSWPWTKVKRQQARQDYEAVTKQIEKSEGAVAQKARFTTDVGGLDIAGTTVIKALADLVSGVTSVETMLTGAAERVDSVASSAADDQLTNPAWLNNALEIDALEALAPAARDFVQHALIETHIQPPPQS